MNTAKNVKLDRASVIILVTQLCIHAILIVLCLLYEPLNYQPDALIYPSCCFLLGLTIWVFWSWYILTKSLFSPYILFFISALLFNGGQAILEIFNLTSAIDAKAGLHRRLYLGLTKWLIDRYATLGLAASCQVGTVLFNQAGKTDSRCRILYYGVDLTPFHNIVDFVAVRAELGIPADAFVIGHVGRFEEQKNHIFLIDIVAEIAKREPNIHLLLIGDGSLRSAIEKKVIQNGLAKRVTFTDIRPDVPRLMLGAMDLFLLPSIHEALGLVLIEAQAAGLPCVFSDVVPEEANAVTPLVRQVSLSKSASEWAEAVISAKTGASAIAQADTLPVLKNSPFNIVVSVKKLTEVYEVN
jgi:glycosyltransferase involved in cell wall biosynthesis